MGKTGSGAESMEMELDFGSEAFSEEEREKLLGWYRTEHGLEDLTLVSYMTFLINHLPGPDKRTRQHSGDHDRWQVPDMTKVTFVEPDGNRHVVDAVVSDTVMTTATSNLVTGMIGDCGGGLSWATCHVLVDKTWADAVGGPGDDESGMVETTAVAATERSRLNCPIVVSEALSGLVLHVPERQE